MQGVNRCSLVVLLASAAALALWSVPSPASGGRQGVQQKPGEIVVLRDVSARQAVRPAPPGMALIVDPSPKDEINRMLGVGELSDDEYSALGSSTGMAVPTQTTVERVTDGAVSGTLGAVTGSNGPLSGNGLNQTIGVPMGAVGNATRGIGDQVRGALAQFPLLGQPATSTPPGG